MIGEDLAEGPRRDESDYSTVVSSATPPCTDAVRDEAGGGLSPVKSDVRRHRAVTRLSLPSPVVAAVSPAAASTGHCSNPAAEAADRRGCAFAPSQPLPPVVMAALQ